MIRHYLVAALLLTLSACAPYTLVDAKKVGIEGAFTVEPNRQWNKVTLQMGQGPIEIWTADGQMLDSVTFIAGIAHGASILKRKESEDPMPTFNENMSPAEVMELVEATIGKAVKSALIEAKNLRQITLGGVPGFRFDLSYVKEDDNVDRDGFVFGTVRNKKLYLVIFQGTKLYHFNKNAPAVEAIVNSLQFL